MRCLAKYLYEKGLIVQQEFTVETLAGIITPRIYLGKDKKVNSVTVNMGTPELSPSKIPLSTDAKVTVGKDQIISESIDVDGTSYKITAVSMGNPHAVIFVDSIDDISLEDIGPKIENHPLFPEKTNVEFVEVKSDEQLIMKVWERGAGVTLACGTGACAVLVAAVLNGKSKEKASIQLDGGMLEMYWDRDANIIYKTGDATLVFEGRIII